MVSTISSIAIALSLIFNRIHGNLHLSFEKIRQPEYNIGNDSPVSANSEIDVRYPNLLAWRWPFNLKHLAETGRSDQKILFPGIMVESAKLTAESVPTCAGQTFCTDVPNYPSKLVDTFLKYNPQFQNYTNIDEMDKDVSLRNFNEDGIICRTVIDEVFPKTAQADGKKWMYVLNGPNFKQGVRVERCIKEGEECKRINADTQGYKTTCKQKYVYRELIVGADDGKFTRSRMRFPTSCCCHIEFSPMEYFRVGRASSLQSSRFNQP